MRPLAEWLSEKQDFKNVSIKQTKKGSGIVLVESSIKDLLLDMNLDFMILCPFYLKMDIIEFTKSSQKDF